MTQENDPFTDIIDNSFDVDERKLLIDTGKAVFHVMPIAKRWTFNSLPDHFYHQETSVMERLDIIGFGIMAYIEMVFYCAGPHYMKLTEGFKDG